MQRRKGERIMEQNRRKPMPLWLMIPLDVALMAGCILSFAYFHHVRPAPSDDKPIDLMAGFTSTTTSATTTTMTTPVQITTTTTNTDASGEMTTTLTGDTGSTAATGTTLSGQRTQSSALTTSSTTTTTTTTAPPTYDYSGWASKWGEIFSVGDEVVITDNSYRSHDVYINIETRQVNTSVAYIADVYIRNIGNFAAAFAKDTYGRSIYEWPQSMAERHNAILAVNADYYTGRDTGIIVRNGQLYRNVEKGDVGSIFLDGTMRNDTKTSFDLETYATMGLYQTMTFGPMLVTNGEPVLGFSGSIAKANPRTGFGYYEPGHYCMIVVDGRQEGYSIGLTMDEFAMLFDELGCQEAYNLDGGQSAMMIFNGEVYNKPYKGGRETGDIFYFSEVN